MAHLPMLVIFLVNVITCQIFNLSQILHLKLLTWYQNMAQTM
jgi:hypothetical protein